MIWLIIKQMKKKILFFLLSFSLFAFRSPLDVLASFPAGQPTVPPVTFSLWDYNNVDFGRDYPQYGPMGGIFNTTWNRINPGRGAFNWEKMDNDLNKASAMRTAPFPDGTTIPKPVIINIDFWGAGEGISGWPYYHIDYTPAWVYQSGAHSECINQNGEPCAGGESGRTVGHVHKFCQSGQFKAYAAAPAVDDSNWQEAYFNLIREMGRKYGNDSKVAGFTIATGLDGEAVMIKSYSECNPPDRPFSAGSYKNFLIKLAQVTRESFPGKPAYLLTGGSEYSWIVNESAYNGTPRLGIKSAALLPDNAHYEYLDGVLTDKWPLAYFKLHPDTSWAFEDAGMPLWAEQDYFQFMRVLSGHVDWVDWRGKYDNWKRITQVWPDFWTKFVPKYLGKRINEVDSVWAVMWETKRREGGADCPVVGGHNTCCWRDSLTGKQMCQYGHIGDFQYWLYRLDGKPGGATVPLWKENLPVSARDEMYAMSTRRTDQGSGNKYLYFRADDNLSFKKSNHVGYKIKINLLNNGNDKFGLEYKTKDGQSKSVSADKGSALGTVGKFVTKTFELRDMYLGNGVEGADFRLTSLDDGDEIIHMVLLEKGEGLAPTLTPTLTPIPPAAGRKGWNVVSGSFEPSVSCSYVVYLKDGWFYSYVRDYSSVQNFPSGEYWVFCR